MGGMGGMNVNPQMGPAMEEFRKNAVKLKGMPLLQTMSFGSAGSGAQATNTQTAPQDQSPQQSKDQDSSPSSARESIGKSLGGVFGHKKKQEQKESDSSSGSSAQSASSSGSLMDMQVEVTSYSSDSLNKSLFATPEGYNLVQRDPDEGMGGRKK
jgi:hypothetical protein